MELLCSIHPTMQNNKTANNSVETCGYVTELLQSDVLSGGKTTNWFSREENPQKYQKYFCAHLSGMSGAGWNGMRLECSVTCWRGVG